MADEKWSAFPSTSSLSDSDTGAVLQSGTNKKHLLSVLKSYMQAAFDAIYVPLTRTISTTAPITGGGALSADKTFAMHVADTTHDGYLSSADWNTFHSGLSSPAALTRTNDTNVTATLGGTPTTALLQATSITLGWTGQLAAGRGGTGVSSLGNITKTDDTNVTLTLGGTPTGAVVTSTSFTLGWTGILASGRGGTGNGFTKLSGPTTSEKTKTLRDATDTILELGGSYTPTGTWTSLTMVTPVLGTPASGTLTNCTGYTDANLSTSDITTNNVSTSKHGFAPKSPNDATQYLDGTGAYSVPPGTGGGTTSKVTGSNFTTATGTLDNITGLTFAAASGHVYEVDALLKVQHTSTNGMKFAINNSGSGSGQFVVIASQTQNGVNQSYQTAPVGSSESTAVCIEANLDFTVHIKAIVTTTSSGNITVQVQRLGAAQTATIYIGSRMTVTQLS